MGFWIQVVNFLVWFPIVVFYLVSWPFRSAYAAFLCCLAWYRLAPGDNFVVVIHDNKKDADGYLKRFLGAVVVQPACLLDYQERKSWPTWSLPVRLFWTFGPIPLPPMFLPNYLPAVVLIKRFKRPRNYSFGKMARDRGANWERLQADLSPS